MVAVFSSFSSSPSWQQSRSMELSGAAVGDTVPWQEGTEGWGCGHSFPACQHETAGSMCVDFCAEESCTAACHFSFRPLGTERLLLWEMCWGRSNSI